MKIKLYRSLTSLSVLIFFLLVLGGTVRNLGAGLSCPDWPLCMGKIIPPFDVRVYAEYFHRLVAALVSILLLIVATIIFTDAKKRHRLGKPMALAIALLISQIILGGLTVLKLLKSEIVTLHLATGTLFFGTISYMALREREWFDRSVLVAESQMAIPNREPVDKKIRSFASHRINWGLVTISILFLQIILGGVVSSHYAGLACPDFPTCLGTWWPGFNGVAGIHFTHRLGATTVFIVVTSYVTYLLRSKQLPRDISYKAWGIAALLLTQVLLGIGNVVYHLPVAMSVAHLAVAEALFVLILVSAYEIRDF